MNSAAGPPSLSTASPARPRPTRTRPITTQTQPQPPVAPKSHTGQGTGDPSPPRASIIVPTFNESENIAVLLERLAATMVDVDYEIIVVDDDSQDSTWRIAERIAMTDNRIRVIRRVDERGLSSAVVAGMQAATGQSLVVIDADLQHDETKIPDLVAAVVDDGADICLGSREVEGGSYGAFQRHRRFASWTGAALARQLLGLPVSDPMSGFFAVSRDRFELLANEVNPRGFKILLEFLARGPKPQVHEVGYEFGERLNGTTKLNSSVVLAYLVALTSLMKQRLRRRLRSTSAAGR